MAQAWNSNTKEAKVGKSPWVWGQLGLCSEFQYTDLKTPPPTHTTHTPTQREMF